MVNIKPDQLAMTTMNEAKVVQPPAAQPLSITGHSSFPNPGITVGEGGQIGTFQEMYMGFNADILVPIDENVLRTENLAGKAKSFRKLPKSIGPPWYARPMFWLIIGIITVPIGIEITLIVLSIVYPVMAYHTHAEPYKSLPTVQVFAPLIAFGAFNLVICSLIIILRCRQVAR